MAMLVYRRVKGAGFVSGNGLPLGCPVVLPASQDR